MADLSITAANVVASNQAIVEKRFNFGATITQGQVVYLDTNNLWQLVDANAAATGNEVNTPRGVALSSGANGQPGVVVTRDVDFTPGATLTNGAAYFASPNAGAIAPSADIVGTNITGNYPTFLGLAKSATKLNLNPTAAGVTVA